MRILFLSRWYPYPPDNGSKIRVYGLLRGLCERHDVTLVSFHDPAENPGAPDLPGPSLIRVSPFREFDRRSGRALLGYLSAAPRYLVDTHSTQMEQLIRQTVRDTRFDVVIASQLSMAAYHESFRGIPSIFEEAELGTYVPAHGHSSARLRQRLTWAKHTRYMSRLLGNFACCTVASDVERDLLAGVAPRRVPLHVVPNSVDTDPVAGGMSRVPDSLIFTGSVRYAPNRDAIAWFRNEIFPEVRTKVPSVRLTITGDADPLFPPPAPDVILTGRVQDVRPLVAASAVSLAPIRVGGGTRLKILEAMAAGTPVVATSKAAEGLGAHAGTHLMIADTPREFADAVHSLLRDPAGARQMADRAWHLCHERYDARTVATQFLRLVDRVAA